MSGLPITYSLFMDASGGLPLSSKPYSSIDGFPKASSAQKRHIFWHFLENLDPTIPDDNVILQTRTVYSGQRGITIQQLLDRKLNEDVMDNVHSIEHVVPKTRPLYRELKPRTEPPFNNNEVVFGSTMNPLNFLPCAARVNSRRSSLAFSFDEDEPDSELLIEVNQIGERFAFDGGRDAEGEWVVPSITRGDVARCVVYMIVAYKLKNYATPNELRVLQRWMLQDKPGRFEIRFNEWLRTQAPILSAQGTPPQNPFVTQPNLARSPNFDNLIMDALDMSLPPERHGERHEGHGINESGDHEQPNVPVAIESVMPNPRGLDRPGEEWIEVRNHSEDTFVSDQLWFLEIQNRDNPARRFSFSLPNGIRGYESLFISFPEANTLPNRAAVTIKLKLGDDVVSTLSYNRTRAGREIIATAM